MIEDQKVTQPPVEQSGSAQALPINRDGRFVRIAADDIIVIQRLLDVQISLIAEGPDPVEQDMPGRKLNGFPVQEVQFEHSYTEIARVGLPSAKAFSMAMNIIENAVESGRISIPVLRDRFLAMLAEHEKSGPKSPTKSPTSKRKK
jgi:hypothetical protein